MACGGTDENKRKKEKPQEYLNKYRAENIEYH